MKENENKILQCRICYNTNGNLKSIFKEGKIMNEIVTLATLLSEILTLEVRKDDGLGQYMCLKCALKLIKACTFRRDCLKSYKALKIRNGEEFENSRMNKTSSFTKRHIDAIHQNIEKIDIDEKESILFEPLGCNDFEELHELEDISTQAKNGETLEFQEYKQKKTKHADSYKCKICSKILGKLSSLKYHMDIHSEKAKYECTECHEKFKTKNAFLGHMATHNGLFACDLCNKSYRQAASLKNHKLSHNPNSSKPFVCSICDKDFIQKSGLKKHLLTHTNLKMFKCSEINCGKEFRYSSNYYVHLKSHKGERNYECSECQKKFGSKEQVKRHKFIHTGEKPFICNLCDRAFNRKSALSVHMRTHEKMTKNLSYPQIL
ncbi:zinc finger protein OZF-like [Culicoides brevitarsis]|uniref:zinc finger protein OZF-like n=1 Tax=Culicoides brevitarsis TaxID=469753 RepID=UPI00307BB6D6